jgi:uncharacterized protein
MKRIIYTLTFLLTISFTVAAQDSKEEKPEMKTYYFVLLTKGPKRTQDSATSAQIQKDHMANMKVLADQKKLVVAGPFVDDGNWRGIFIFDAKSKEEVEELLKTDRAISSGRLTYEIHPWMTQKGTVFY